MNIHDKQDCKSNILRINELISCGIFNAKIPRDPLQKSAFIELMICLRDLLHKTATHAKRIDFTEDILTNDYVKDVTDAITAVRDACCHINSFKKVLDEVGSRASYGVCYGKGILAKVDDLELKSEYDDDTAFFYGRNRLYFKRHILRAFKEAQAELAPHLAA